jgi:DNA-directed RNA polymerase subunit M/transcription elongation factor TFIIS
MNEPFEYCPNCVEKLKPQHKKKLGLFSAWWVCPQCGYRTREAAEYFADQRKHALQKSTRLYINNTFKEF